MFKRSTSIAFAFSVAMSATTTTAMAYDVRLQGALDEELTALLEGGSLLFQRSTEEEPLNVREIVSTAQADYQRLLAILYDEGYFGPTIRIRLDGVEASSILAVSPPRSVSSAVITVAPGRAFRFGVAEVAPLAANTTLPPGFQTGETARISLLQSAANAAISGWRDAGYAKAELADQQITARHSQGALDARLKIATGPRLRFGALGVDGESYVRQERILEIAGLPEGEQFSPQELKDAADRLRRSGAFRSVALIEGDVTSGSDVLPVDVRVTDNKPRRFGFGGEIATIEGVTISGYWLHRNLLGGAESLRIDAEIGGIGGTSGGVGGAEGGTDYLLRSTFRRPATFRKDFDFIAFGEIEQEDEPNYFSRQTSFGAGFEYIESDERRYSIGLGFRRALTEDLLGERDYTIVSLPVGALFDYRDYEFDARRGFYLDAGLTPFLALSGTQNGLLTDLDFRTYKTFGSSSPTTLALRAQLGSLIGPSLRESPADFLFYSGGGDTVRGQDYQSLGIQVGPDEDDIVGGRSFLGLSAEVRFRTEGSLGFVGFVDAGYIGEEAFPDGSSGEWHSGAGLGVRYATPIGPIRFDVAVPTSGPDDDAENFQIYIGIGHAF
ncbi:MAG: BamA/TamA family outer membrane protein [Pseudomonadota bacterium]